MSLLFLRKLTKTALVISSVNAKQYLKPFLVEAGSTGPAR